MVGLQALLNVVGKFCPCDNMDIKLTKTKWIKIGTTARMQDYRSKEAEIFLYKRQSIQQISEFK